MKKKKEKKIRVILISSVRPEPTSGGQIILYRHLVNKPGIELEVYGEEPKGFHWTALMRRLVGKLGKIISPKIAGDFWVFWRGRWIDPSLPKYIDKKQPTVVMTVAHGEGCMAAMRFAKKHNLPLISFFQDWWPDMEEFHSLIKKRVEKTFLRLAKESKVNICVSEGMIKALGTKNSIYLPDIPESQRISKKSQKKLAKNKKFKMLYFGNLGDYGPMLGEALKTLDGNNSIELVVRGRNPKWPDRFARKMKKKGAWLEFAPREELDKWLQTADAFLIPMVFESSMRRRMETSFPSKLIEFSHFGKPLIVWGPEYCSAIQWARQGSKALAVIEPEPEALVRAVEKLAADKVKNKKLSAAATRAAKTEFNPTRIQKKFMEILKLASATKSAL